MNIIKCPECGSIDVNVYVFCEVNTNGIPTIGGNTSAPLAFTKNFAHGVPGEDEGAGFCKCIDMGPEISAGCQAGNKEALYVAITVDASGAKYRPPLNTTYAIRARTISVTLHGEATDVKNVQVT